MWQNKMEIKDMGREEGKLMGSAVLNLAAPEKDMFYSFSE
jgi:hypothetical protein